MPDDRKTLAEVDAVLKAEEQARADFAGQLQWSASDDPRAMEHMQNLEESPESETLQRYVQNANGSGGMNSPYQPQVQMGGGMAPPYQIPPQAQMSHSPEEQKEQRRKAAFMSLSEKANNNKSYQNAQSEKTAQMK